MARPNHCLIIGLDGAVPELIEEYSKQGVLPNIAKLIRNGSWAENCLPPLPNTSPTCWATVATGASPATHGVTSGSLYDAALPLTEVRDHKGYASESTKAETMWEAAERAGMRSLLISYPTSWPPKTQGVQIGTTDTSVTDGSFGIKHQLFSTENISAGLKINLEKGQHRLHAELVPEMEQGYWILDYDTHPDVSLIDPLSWKVEVTKENDVLYYGSQGSASPLAKLRKGQWSEDLRIAIQTDAGSKDMKYRIKVIDVAYEEEKLTTYITRMVTTPCVVPPSLAPVIDTIEGIPSYRDYFNSPHLDTIDLDTFIEIQMLGFDWISEAVRRCQSEQSCEMTVVYTVSIDTVNHLYRNILEGESRVEQDVYQQASEIERRTYEAIDWFVGKLLEIPQENRLVVLVSDHSAVAYCNDFRLEEVLKQAGLLVTRQSEDGEKVMLGQSKAICQGDMHIYVNLKGRNPGGIVDKEDYEDVVNRIIAALYDYTDPETRCKPVALALRKEDARIVGLCGDGVGDVVVAVGGGFGRIPGDDVHGHRLPGGWYKGKNMNTVLLFSGPGIRKGFRVKRTVALKDIAPTIAHLMEFPAPRDTEGGIIYQMLEP